MTVEDIGNLFLMVLAKVDGDGLAVVMVTRYIKIKIFWENEKRLKIMI